MFKIKQCGPVHDKYLVKVYGNARTTMTNSKIQYCRLVVVQMSELLENKIVLGSSSGFYCWETRTIVSPLEQPIIGCPNRSTDIV